MFLSVEIPGNQPVKMCLNLITLRLMYNTPTIAVPGDDGDSNTTALTYFH